MTDTTVGLSLPDEVADRCAASHDALDALIAALPARAAALGKTVRPADGTEAERAPVEGWIHLPVCEPAELLG